jgi:hypothetical protein
MRLRGTIVSREIGGRRETRARKAACTGRASTHSTTTLTFEPICYSRSSHERAVAVLPEGGGGDQHPQRTEPPHEERAQRLD